jgi:hypothetical protein
MSDIDTYDGLVAFVTDHLQLDADTVAQLANLVRLAELKLNRMVLGPEREVVATSSTIAGQQALIVPPDFRQARSVVVDDTPLTQVALNVLQSQFSSEGQPQAYALVDSAIYFGPIPDNVYAVSLTYLADFVPLTSDNQTNWLTQSNPDAYVYALCAECEAFRGNTDGAGVWLGHLGGVIDEINKQGQRYRNSVPVRLRSPVVV